MNRLFFGTLVLGALGATSLSGCKFLKKKAPEEAPSAAAAEKEVMMMPMPCARRWGGTTSETIAITVAPLTPPNAPHRARAIISVPAVCDRPQARVASAKPA